MHIVFKLLPCLISVFTLSFAYAGQGVFIQLNSHYPGAELEVSSSECMSNVNTNISANTKTYVETVNTNLCFFKKSSISYNILLNGKILQNYDIHFSANGTSISSGEQKQRQLYQISAQLYPHSGLGTQDTVLFHLQNKSDAWQKNAEKNIKNLSINQVMTPGSHDSGTYLINSESVLTADASTEYLTLASQFGFKPYIIGWSKTQNLSILEQLNYGIRYFDLRWCGSRLNGNPIDNANNIYICHTLSSITAKKTIDDVAEFLENPDHEKEIIFLDINHLYNLSDAQIEEITNYISEKLGYKIAEYGSLTPISTYNEFWEAEKQVILFMAENKIAERYNSIYWPIHTISSPWPDTLQTDLLLQSMELNLKNRNLNQFFVLQSQKTPHTNAILDGFNIFTSEPRNLRELTGRYQLDVLDWFLNNQNTLQINGNIYISDFVGGTL